MYQVVEIKTSDGILKKRVLALLQGEGIRLDQNLDYTCALVTEDFDVVATGSMFGNTLRCLAVSGAHQGEGLMNQVMTHLMDLQFQRGNTEIFLYTKVESARFFSDLSFSTVAKVEGNLVFMEHQKNGFSKYLSKLEEKKVEGNRVAAVVMNANPFSLGHLYLLEEAARENDVLHLFFVSEDVSLVPYEVRKKLLLQGTTHLKNLVFHETGSYMISSATFPSYFQKDEEAVTYGHALLDLTIFQKIATALGVTHRYVGEEKTSQVTALYNRVMKEELPKSGVEVVEIPRKEWGHGVISASTIRTALKNDDFDLLRELVPPSTLQFFQSSEAQGVIEGIKACEDVIHH